MQQRAAEASHRGDAGCHYNYCSNLFLLANDLTLYSQQWTVGLPVYFCNSFVDSVQPQFNRPTATTSLLVRRAIATDVARSECVGRTGEPCKNGWTDRVAVWWVDSDGCKEPRSLMDGSTLAPPVEQRSKSARRQQCGTVSSLMWPLVLYTKQCFDADGCAAGEASDL